VKKILLLILVLFSSSASLAGATFLDCGLIKGTGYHYRIIKTLTNRNGKWATQFFLQTQPAQGGETRTFVLVNSGSGDENYTEYYTKSGNAGAYISQGFKSASLLLNGNVVADCVPLKR
jgi:hypothetical protein